MVRPAAEGGVADRVEPRVLGQDAGFLQLEIGPDRSGNAYRHVDQEHHRQLMAARKPPRIRPSREPPMKAIWFKPRAMPLSEEGKASVRMAALLANRKPPPIAWIRRKMIISMAPALPVLGISREQDGADREDDKAEVIEAHPAEDVGQPPEGDQQGGRYYHVAHQHPEQVTRLVRGQRIDLESHEDGRQGNQDDGAVDAGHQRAQGGVGKGYPFVARLRGFCRWFCVC